MQTHPRIQQGRLFDLGPDGLGFIIPTDSPSKKLAFTLRLLKLKTFEEAGLYEGALVQFQINEKQQIDGVSAVEISKPELIVA